MKAQMVVIDGFPAFSVLLGSSGKKSVNSGQVPSGYLSQMKFLECIAILATPFHLLLSPYAHQTTIVWILHDMGDLQYSLFCHLSAGPPVVNSWYSNISGGSKVLS